MVDYNVVPQRNVGDPDSAQDWNDYVKNNFEFFRDFPLAAYIFCATAAAITTATQTPVTGMTDQYLDGLNADGAGTYIELVRTSSGDYYAIWVNVKFENNNTGYRKMGIQLYDSVAATWGSTFTLETKNPINGESTVLNGFFLLRLLDTKFTRIRPWVYHTKGSNLNLELTTFAVARVRVP